MSQTHTSLFNKKQPRSPRVTEWDRDAALITARLLLEIQAVNFRPDDPYLLTAGWKSPVYIDCRKIIFYPRARAKIIELGVEKIYRHVGYESFDAVVGGETAGIPFAAWFADRMMTPMAYVRKKPKGFGKNAQIEGDVPENMRTLLVEDLTTDGISKVGFAKALRKAGAIVDHAFVVFFYGVFSSAYQTLNDIGISLHSLCTWWDFLEVSSEYPAFSNGDTSEIRRFLEDPCAWSAKHGGVSNEQEALAYKQSRL